MGRKPDVPEFLYHGSESSGLEVLEPRSVHSGLRPDRTPLLIVSPSPAVASCFLSRWHDDLAKLGTWDGGRTWIFRIRNPDTIEFTGGSIYKVSSEGFTYNPDEGLGWNEWMSATPVPVLDEERWASSLAAMQHHGIQVRWPMDQTMAVARLREALQSQGLRVSPWRVFVAGVASEFDLLVLERGPPSGQRLVYEGSDVLAVLEVEGIAPFDKRSPGTVKDRFEQVRNLNQRVACAYTLVVQEETQFAKLSDELLGFPVYDLRWSAERELLRAGDEWNRLLCDLYRGR